MRKLFLLVLLVLLIAPIIPSARAGCVFCGSYGLCCSPCACVEGYCCHGCETCGPEFSTVTAAVVLGGIGVISYFVRRKLNRG